MKRRKGKIVQVIPVFVVLFCQFFSLQIKAEENAPKNWTLSFGDPVNSQLLLNITKYSRSHNISVEQPIYGGYRGKEYKISAVLLHMKVQNGADEFSLGFRPTPGPSIHVSNSRKDAFEVHAPYNYTEDSFNYHEVSNDSQVYVIAVGDWKDGDFAQVILTAYYDEESCYFCSPNAFCCNPAQGCEDSKIDFTVSDDGRTRVIQLTETIHEISMKHKARNSAQRRCIPDVLTCNELPNCGHFCNHDESDEVCRPVEDGMCMNYECYWDMSFVWTALLAIVFFVISPTVVVFLICYHRQLTVITRRRQHRGSDSSVVIHSPPNDLPPTYDELHGGDEPPPCFCRATSMIDGINSNHNGIDNPTFYPDDSMTVQKSGSISIPVIECSCNNNNNNSGTLVTTPAPVPVPVPASADNDDKTESQNNNHSRNPISRETMTIPMMTTMTTTTTRPLKSQHDNANDGLESQNNNNSNSNIDSHV